MLSMHDEQNQQWRHHFESVLNCPDPPTLYNFTSVAIPKLDICIDDDLSITEAQAAIKHQSMKCYRQIKRDSDQAVSAEKTSLR